MIFDLHSFRDLGRCSYATLKPTFDTEKDHIHLGFEEVTIARVEDLFPFLWRAPGSYCSDGGQTHAFFQRLSPDSHWHADYDPSIARDEAEAAKLGKKLAKDPGNRNAAKWKANLEYYRTTADGLRKLVDQLDAERKGIEQQITRDNNAG
jgi:hypothetical protein